MAGTDSDGRVATTLLTDWLRYLLGNARHRPITAQDLVFRDLYALVADHQATKIPLSELYDEIRRFATVPDAVALGLHTTIDAVAAEDPTFATRLEELLHVLRPLTPDEPPHPGGSFADTGLVAPVLGGGDSSGDGSGDGTVDDHPYFATTPDPVVTLHLPGGHREVETAVVDLLAAADADVIDEASMTATCLRHLGAVIAVLRPHEEAVLRVGAVVLVKQGPRLTVQELTPEQRARFDHDPGLAGDPRRVLAALEPDEGFTGPA